MVQELVKIASKGIENVLEVYRHHEIYLVTKKGLRVCEKGK